MKKIALITALLLCFNANAKDVLPQKVTGLINPESVLQDKNGNIFVSEIGEFGKYGDGKISVIDKKGKLKVLAKDLDDPTGIVLMDDKLYVTDIDKVKEVDMAGNVSVLAEAKDFPKKPQFLNDIETDHFGNLYVSDSGDLKSGGAVFKIDKNKSITIIVDSSNAKILAPNGLLYEGRNSLLEADFASGVLYRINLKSGEMTEIADGFGGADGIVKTSNSKIYVSDWKNGLVNFVSAKKARLFIAGLTSSADMALSNNGKYLIVPLMKIGEIQFVELK
jgi:gluconolactonase